jgi:hypothetical protein
MCSISCHKNTKFLHAIAEVCLYHMHKKWNSYVYLEPDSTIGNYEVRITTFIITTRPLQFTHCTDIRFLWHCLWNSIVTITSSNSVLSDTLQNTALSKVTFSTVRCSALFHSFSGPAAGSLHTQRTRFPHQSSRCLWNSTCINCSLPSDMLVSF